MADLDGAWEQEGPLRALGRLLQSGRLPHALLFTGIDGVGKRSTALRLAMALNCAGLDPAAQTTLEACHSCRPCRNIVARMHPDVILVEPRGQFIKIDQIRELCHTLSLRPYEAKTRVVIVAGGGALNPEAANALLKSLEEPPPRTMYVITARQRADLLPTVASRCQEIRFNPLPHPALARYVETASGLDAAAAGVIAAAAEGSMARATAMLESDWLGLRNWLIRELGRLAEGSYSLTLALAAKLARDKAIIPDILDILQLWFRDLVVCKFSPEAIVNRDIMDIIEKEADRLKGADALACLKAVQRAEADIARNTHPRLAMEAMLLCILDGKYGLAHEESRRNPF